MRARGPVPHRVKERRTPRGWHVHPSQGTLGRAPLKGEVYLKDPGPSSSVIPLTRLPALSPLYLFPPRVFRSNKSDPNVGGCADSSGVSEAERSLRWSDADPTARRGPEGRAGCPHRGSDLWLDNLGYVQTSLG